jgi:polyisoprenoid-binding protein YceI
MRASHGLRAGLIIAAAAAFPGVAAAQEATTRMFASVVSGTLSFVGHATVGDFVGSTTSVSGELSGDRSNPRAWVEAPVTTLVTGNGRRDRDLRKSMEADRYPTLRLDVTGVRWRPESDTAILHGTFTIHGVTREVELPVVVSQAGDTMQVTSTFPIDLSDYRVGGLTKAFGLLRMQSQIEVSVHLLFRVLEPPVVKE